MQKLRQRWFFHRTLMYTEKEIVEKGLEEGEGPSLPRLASCKLDLQMVPCGSCFEKSSIDMKRKDEISNMLRQITIENKKKIRENVFTLELVTQNGTIGKCFCSMKHASSKV